MADTTGQPNDQSAPGNANPPSSPDGATPPIPTGRVVQPYDVVPTEPVQSPQPSLASRVAAEAAKASPATPGKIAGPGVLDGFDEDADFDLDPEVANAKVAAKTGGTAGVKPGTKPGMGMGRRPDDAPAAGEEDRRMVIPGRGELKTIAIVGAAVAFAAAVGAAINAAPDRNRFLVSLSLVFDVALHAVTGVGALMMAAAMLGKVVRHTELAAARLLVATAVFALGFQLNFGAQGHVLGLALAAGLYFLAVWWLFKLKPEHALVVGAFHFALWILLYLHHYLLVWAAPAAKVAPVVAPAAGV